MLYLFTDWLPFQGPPCLSAYVKLHADLAHPVGLWVWRGQGGHLCTVPVKDDASPLDQKESPNTNLIPTDASGFQAFEELDAMHKT